MPKRDQHVVPHTDGRAVKVSGNQRATSVHPTQREAVGAARNIARNQGTEMFIHGENGRIRRRNTYGNDPHPPKG